ncbi:hypothetical protein BVY01_03890 [bacterium I07]|nr:hypothetical protein BVY01_03890 [bacterium I07]
MMAQILFMRELIVMFYGNELSLGAMLAVWLLGTAAGSRGAQYLVRFPVGTKNITTLILNMAWLLPVQLIFLRFSKHLTGTVPGEIIGFVPMLLTAMVVLFPFCFFSGILYSVFCRYFHQHFYDGNRAIRNVYLLEAAGAAIGGLTASLLIIPVFSPARIVLMLSLIHILFAFRFSGLFSNRIYRLPALIILLAVFSLANLYGANTLQRLLDKLSWRGYHLLHSTSTPYGSIGITGIENQISFHQNGLLMFTIPDQMSAENSVHYALLQHPDPRKVLLIGGGAAGGIQEVIKHPSIAHVDYVEIDPELINLAKKYSSAESASGLQNSKVHIHHTDARQFLRRSGIGYDAILVQLPAPYNSQLNRFYTLEFFREAKSRLIDKGIFAFQAPSSENAMSPEMIEFLSHLYSTLASVFDDILLLPGHRMKFMACSKSGILTGSPDELARRLRTRQIETNYVRDYYFSFELSKERQMDIKEQIYTMPQARWNRDFKPAGYYYDTMLWATTYSKMFKSIFAALSQLKLGHLILAAALILTTALPAILKKRSTTAVRASLFVIGYTEISLEIILILAFQVIYGYAYQMIALLIAGYMSGVAAGSYLSELKIENADRIFKRFRILQLSMIVYPLSLILILSLLHSNQPGSIISWPLFIILTAGAGIIGGMQFPLANRILSKTVSIQKVAGQAYSLDLVGSSLGALTTSAFLIPILGIYQTLLLIACLNSGAWILLNLTGSGQS